MTPTMMKLAALSLLPLAACSESEPQGRSNDQSPPQTPPQTPDAGPDNNQAAEKPPTTPPEPADPDRADRGRILFAVSPGNCAKCHTPNATGSDRAPDLTTGNFNHSDGTIQGIQQVIIAGVAKEKLSSQHYPFAMNPRGSTNLNDQQCLDLAHYIRSLND